MQVTLVAVPIALTVFIAAGVLLARYAQRLSRRNIVKDSPWL